MEPNKKYDITTKYPFILGGNISGLSVIAVVYDYRLLTNIIDLPTRHARLLSMDNTLPDLLDIDLFYVFRDPDGELLVMPMEYIADVRDA